MGYPSPERPQPKRGDTSGWSRDVARRNTDFLMSVQADLLTGHGHALSLTIKECPASPSDWQKVRRSFVKRLERLDMLRMHWLTEWQKRQVPHLHAAVWFSEPQPPGRISQHWLSVASSYQAGPLSQHVSPIYGSVGWFEYLAKHATRSVSNYQRSPHSVPPAWKGVTGRMWGHIGSWPLSEPKELELCFRSWWQYRRLMIRYQISKARRQKDSDRVRYLKAYRSKAPEESSAVQALPRFWIPEDDQWALLSLCTPTDML
jgi:hypothetical protein